MGYNLTPEEWRERMSKCTDPDEMKHLLKIKPKGMKSAITTGTPKIFNGADGLPLLDRLIKGEKV